MASATPLKDIEENFLLCPVCLDLFKDPKILGCLHRYCKGCLDGILKKQKDVFKCPMCKRTFTSPKNGAEDFKTDFHVKSVVEFIVLQKSFESKEAKKCVGCKRLKTVTAYCFKCKNFLCEQCYEFHLENEMVKYHKQHILDLKDAGTKKLTLEKLASLREVPRCHLHAEHPAQLCCCSCGNVPVCVACTFGQHRGHDLHEVLTLAQAERRKLKENLADLEKYKDNLYKMRRTIDTARKELESGVARKKEELKAEYEAEAQKIEEETKQNDDKLKLRKSETKKDVEQKCQQLEIKMEDEIQKIRKKYADETNEVKTNGDQSIVQYEAAHRVKECKITERTGIMKKKSDELDNELEVQERTKRDKIQEISEESEQIIQRYETFTSSVAAILASKNDWTDVQCVPDISVASETLKTELEGMKVPDVVSLSDVIVGLSGQIVDKVTISEDAESVLDVSKGYAFSMVGCADGKIVLGFDGSIEVFNVKDHTMHAVQSRGRNYCVSMCSRNVAIATSFPNKIGASDTRDYSCEFKQMSDTLKGSGNIDTYSVAYDHVNKQILVGSYDKRDVVVFNEELHCHTISLPDGIEWPRDMKVHGDRLIVCDQVGERACMVTLEGTQSGLEDEFTKPAGSVDPRSVCMDKHGFIYMIWTSTNNGRILAQFSQDGRRLLSTRTVDRSAWRITTLETENGPKLLVASEHEGKLFIYGLCTT